MPRVLKVIFIRLQVKATSTGLFEDVFDRLADAGAEKKFLEVSLEHFSQIVSEAKISLDRLERLNFFETPEPGNAVTEELRTISDLKRLLDR